MWEKKQGNRTFESLGRFKLCILYSYFLLLACITSSEILEVHALLILYRSVREDNCRRSLTQNSFSVSLY